MWDLLQDTLQLNELYVVNKLSMKILENRIATTSRELSKYSKLWKINKRRDSGTTAIPVFQRSLPAGRPQSLSVPTPASIQIKKQRYSWIILFRLGCVCVRWLYKL